MKKRIIRGLLSMMISVSVIGCNTTDVSDSTAENDKYIDLNTVTSYSGTANCLQLNFTDGTGYYLEIPQKSDSLTEVFYIGSESDHDKLLDALENRNGKIVVEISTGTVLDTNGNGQDISGYYRKYESSRFSAGDRVQSIFVYNPENNFIDDILYRLDIKIE